MIRVLVADDQALVRSGLSAILGAQADIEVVGVADLPLPAPKAEPQAPEAGRPPQMDWLDSE